MTNHRRECFIRRIIPCQSRLEEVLFPPWEDDEQRQKPKQIDCTEDDSSALLILLNICHLKFQKIPSWLPYEILLQVAVLCDQYNCVNIVRPWLPLSLWLENESEESLKTGQHGWLFIAWTFGRVEVFEQLSLHMINVIEDHNDDWWMKMTPMPPGIIGA